MGFHGKTQGFDVDGQPRSVGDRDSMGYIVGFIDDHGNCWETLGERDRACSAGRYHDAMIAWERKGKVTPEPDPKIIAETICLDRENVADAVREARQGWAFIVRYRESLLG